MRPPLGVTALLAGDLEYTAAGGLSFRAALKGAPLRTITFIQTRLSFSLVGQPGMTPTRIRNLAVSGIGSLAHYAAITVMKRLGNEKVTYISTNTTGNSYTALLGKAVDAAIVTPPYTSMATLAGYPDFGNTFDVRDLQGGLVARLQYLHDRREQARAISGLRYEAWRASSKTRLRRWLIYTGISPSSRKSRRTPTEFLNRSSTRTVTSRNRCLKPFSRRSSRNPASRRKFHWIAWWICRFCVK